MFLEYMIDSMEATFEKNKKRIVTGYGRCSQCKARAMTGLNAWTKDEETGDIVDVQVCLKCGYADKPSTLLL